MEVVVIGNIFEHDCAGGCKNQKHAPEFLLVRSYIHILTTNLTALIFMHTPRFNLHTLINLAASPCHILLQNSLYSSSL